MAEEKTIGSFISFLNLKIGEAETEIIKKEQEEYNKSIDLDEKPLEKGDSGNYTGAAKDLRMDYVKKAQDLFVNLGYMDNMGEKNYGSFGDKTLAAVKKYQKEKKLDETGKIDKDLYNKISKDWKDKGLSPLYEPKKEEK